MHRIVLMTCLFISAHLFAQNDSGKIKGNVSDEKDKPVEFANITLHRKSDSLFIKGAITDMDGNFEIENIESGEYYFYVTSFIHEKYTSENIVIRPDDPNPNFYKIKLSQSVHKLDEVTVVAEKQFIERKLDKLIVNVENSIVAAGNTTLEVLQRSPGVVVNGESSINLKGKSGVLVMIDGKPSSLAGSELITFLKSIPASNIQLIEIISNPSARYDAAGNAGIINIKFKKDKSQGLNGSVSASLGQGKYSKQSASTNFNLRQKKFNLFGNYSFAKPQNFTYFFINRKFFDQNHDLNSTFEQISYTKQPYVGNNSRLGLDFNPTQKTIIGVLLSGNWGKSKRIGNTNATITNPDGQLDYTTKTSILLDDHRFTGFANVNLKHTIDSTGKELTADLDYGTYDSGANQDINNINELPTGLQILNNKLLTNQVGSIIVKSIKADYVHPISEKSKLELGVKSSIVSSDNDVKFYNVINGQNALDNALTNHFIYKENINAAYASFATEMEGWDVQTGLRLEHTVTHGKQLSTGESFSRNYANLFPNVIINRQISEGNALSFSYAKRIDRPTYRQLNPFKLFVDSYTYVVGDPAIKPVFSNIVELNHTFKGKYITTLSYTNSKQSITDVFVQDDASKISYQIPANIQDFEQYNLGVFLPFSYHKILQSTLSASVYRNTYSSPFQGGILDQSFNSWDITSNNNLNLGGNGWSAEISGFYQSKSVWGLFFINGLSQITAGLQKVSNDKRSTFKLNVSDIFHKNHIAVIVQYQNQDWFTERNWDSTVATFAYTYRFGGSSVAKARLRSSGVEDEKRRAS